MHRSLKGLPLLSELAEPLEALAAAPLDEKAQPQMEAVCAALSDELRRQGLSREEGNVLQVHGRAIQASIEAPNIRTLPILFG
jgi:hypothetical protein